MIFSDSLKVRETLSIFGRKGKQPKPAHHLALHKIIVGAAGSAWPLPREDAVVIAVVGDRPAAAGFVTPCRSLRGEIAEPGGMGPPEFPLTADWLFGGTQLKPHLRPQVTERTLTVECSPPFEVLIVTVFVVVGLGGYGFSGLSELKPSPAAQRAYAPRWPLEARTALACSQRIILAAKQLHRIGPKHLHAQFVEWSHALWIERISPNYASPRPERRGHGLRHSG
jgi:hypothetical protein